MKTQKPFTVYACALNGRFLGSYVLQENVQEIIVNQLFCCKGLVDVTTLVQYSWRTFNPYYPLTEVVYNWWKILSAFRKCQIPTTFNHYNTRFYNNKTK